MEKPLTFSGRATPEGSDSETVVDVSLQYTDSYTNQIYAYANSIFNLEASGTHFIRFSHRP